MNDGALCKCSVKARRSGIRHGIYAGESPPSNHVNHSTHAEASSKSTTEEEQTSKASETEGAATDGSSEQDITNSGQSPVASESNTVKHSLCDPDSNNSGKLYHYRITISPPTNFLVRI